MSEKKPDYEPAREVFADILGGDGPDLSREKSGRASAEELSAISPRKQEMQEALMYLHQDFEEDTSIWIGRQTPEELALRVFAYLQKRGASLTSAQSNVYLELMKMLDEISKGARQIDTIPRFVRQYIIE